MSSLISILFVIFCLVSAFHKNSSRTNRNIQRRTVQNQMPKYTTPAYETPDYMGENNQKIQSDSIRTQNKELQRRKQQAEQKQKETKLKTIVQQKEKMENCSEDIDLLVMDTFGLGMPNQELSACMKEVEDLIVTGYHPKMPEVRDFLAEGLSMLGE